MLLCLVVLYAVAFIKGSGKQGIVAGAALFVLIMILGPISGGSLNPVRSLGPAIFSGYLDGQYVYVIGPIVGAAIAGVVFDTVRTVNHGVRVVGDVALAAASAPADPGHELLATPMRSQKFRMASGV